MKRQLKKKIQTLSAKNFINQVIRRYLSECKWSTNSHSLEPLTLVSKIFRVFITPAKEKDALSNYSEQVTYAEEKNYRARSVAMKHPTGYEPQFKKVLNERSLTTADHIECLIFAKRMSDAVWLDF